MEALRQLLIARTGYPAYRSVAKAARQSGVAESQLSQYIRWNVPGGGPVACNMNYIARQALKQSDARP